MFSKSFPREIEVEPVQLLFLNTVSQKSVGSREPEACVAEDTPLDPSFIPTPIHVLQ